MKKHLRGFTTVQILLVIACLAVIFVGSARAADPGVTWMQTVGGIISTNSNVSSNEFEYLDGVTGAIQTQLDAKPASTNLNASNLASGTVPNARLDAQLAALATSDRNAIVGANSSSTNAVEFGTCTNTQAITFGTEFGATPVVVVVPQGATSGVFTYPSSVATTGFTCNSSNGVTCSYIAIGQK